VVAGQRRSGVGRGLLATGIEALRLRGVARILLEVRAGNAAALAMYTAMGFNRDGVRRAYYPGLDGTVRDPRLDGAAREDAVLMSLSLGDNDASA
jgi:ribosomal-protein-alanine N-acetyltransferase